MITLNVPQFDSFSNYKFIGYKTIEIKNNPDTEDYQKVTASLPGIPQGYNEDFYKIGKNTNPIKISSFYDIRQNQKILKKLDKYLIIIETNNDGINKNT